MFPDDDSVDHSALTVQPHFGWAKSPTSVVLGAEHDGKALLTAAISSDAHQGGTQASKILAEAARTVGGGSQGRGPVALSDRKEPKGDR